MTKNDVCILFLHPAICTNSQVKIREQNSKVNLIEKTVQLVF